MGSKCVTPVPIAESLPRYESELVTFSLSTLRVKTRNDKPASATIALVQDDTALKSVARNTDRQNNTRNPNVGKPQLTKVSRNVMLAGTSETEYPLTTFSVSHTLTSATFSLCSVTAINKPPPSFVIPLIKFNTVLLVLVTVIYSMVTRFQ